MPIVCSSFVQPYQKTYHIPLGKKQYFTTHSFQRYWCIHLIASQGIRWGSHHCQRCHRWYHCLDYHCRNKEGHCVHCCLNDDGKLYWLTLVLACWIWIKPDFWQRTIGHCYSCHSAMVVLFGTNSQIRDTHHCQSQTKLKVVKWW